MSDSTYFLASKSPRTKAAALAYVENAALEKDAKAKKEAARKILAEAAGNVNEIRIGRKAVIRIARGKTRRTIPVGPITAAHPKIAAEFTNVSVFDEWSVVD